MKTIKRVVPKSLAKLMGLMYAVFGFLGGIVFMAIALVAQTEEAGMAGILFGVAAPVFLTIVYGLMGWVGGYIAAWIYNLAAKKVGGIQFETE